MVSVVNKVAILMIALFAGISSIAYADQSIPTDVTNVATGRINVGDQWQDVRLIVTKYCSPEHCFSVGRLEWLKADEPLAIIAVSNISELDSILLVSNARFISSTPNANATFEVQVANTYTGEKGIMYVTPISSGLYEVKVVDSVPKAP